jgi:hypothetical protein
MKAATLRRQAAVILAGGGAILAATAMTASAQANASTSAPAARQTTASGQLVVAPARPLSYWVKNNASPRNTWDKTASVRVSCGGYNGHVDYNNPGTLITLGTYGELWDTCGGTTYLYLSWDELAGLQHHNAQVQTASNHATVGVNQSFALYNGASNVGIAVCSTYGGWHCGPTQHF